MFSRDKALDQLWNIVIGAVIAIFALILYFVLGLVDVYVVQLARAHVSSWIGRALLLLVGLYFVGFAAAKLFRGDQDS